MRTGRAAGLAATGARNQPSTGRTYRNTAASTVETDTAGTCPPTAALARTAEPSTSSASASPVVTARTRPPDPSR